MKTKTKMKTNELEYEDLRRKLRTKKKIKCFDCENTACDIHHIDENHSNNEPENLTAICKKCHNEIHGISPQIDQLGAMVRNFWRMQRSKFMFDNQTRAYKEIGYPTENFVIMSDNLANDLKAIEKIIKKEIKAHELYEEAMRVKGLGPILFSGLVSIIKVPERFSNPSKLWAFFGLHVQDGTAVRRKRGQKLGFSLANRTFSWKIGDSFNKCRNRSKTGALLKQFHEEEKAKTFEPGYLKERYNGYKKSSTQLLKGHALNRARRKTVKIFLACFWAKWLEVRGIEPAELFVQREGHVHTYTWSDLCDK